MPPRSSRFPDAARSVAASVLLAIVVSALFAVDPLVSAVTGDGVPFARLRQPTAYLLGAPVFGVMDTLSLLTLSQHYAVLVTLVAIYVSFRARRPPGEGALLRRVAREAGVGALSLTACSRSTPRGC